MNKRDMVRHIQSRVWVSERAIDSVLNALGGVIVDALCRGEEVHIGSFGVFKPQKRAARTGRNPHTGEAVPIPERVVPMFKPGPTLKNAAIRIIKR